MADKMAKSELPTWDRAIKDWMNLALLAATFGGTVGFGSRLLFGPHRLQRRLRRLGKTYQDIDIDLLSVEAARQYVQELIAQERLKDERAAEAQSQSQLLPKGGAEQPERVPAALHIPMATSVAPLLGGFGGYGLGKLLAGRFSRMGLERDERKAQRELEEAFNELVIALATSPEARSPFAPYQRKEGGLRDVLLGTMLIYGIPASVIAYMISKDVFQQLSPEREKYQLALRALERRAMQSQSYVQPMGLDEEAKKSIRQQLTERGIIRG